MTILKLMSNRVTRGYLGGKLIDEFKGKTKTEDNYRPEDWVGSLTEARNSDIENEGLSYAYTDDNEKVLLKDLVESNPLFYLGKKHLDQFGTNPALLVKILDSAERLGIQVHPDKEKAKKYFDSDFGKTEGWYIMGGREIDGEPPYILLGFKPGVTKERWIELFKKQDIEGMIDSLHKFYVKPEEVYLVNGGTPHAIGSGCLVIEIQEPTDITLVTEKIRKSGEMIPDEKCHQGIGLDNMFDCFNYQTYNREETLNKWRLRNSSQTEQKVNKTIKRELFSKENTPDFQMNMFQVPQSYRMQNDGRFSIFLVTRGEGIINHSGKEFSIKKGESFFMPAAIEEISFHNNGERPFTFVRCMPPVSR